ncbi:MAG TPA: TraB/GumN family protein, partial [Candidatus Mcinerneyibacteriales bacterium]|nr:TraB/GumN family protein [Candidatus Mcinerneyibacteriales bacterium]
MKRFQLTLLALLTLFVVQSCGTSPNPLFYAAHKDGETVYLFGSIHAADESFYPLPEKIETAFESSQALAVEADIRNIDQMEITRFVFAHGMYPEGETLEKALGDEAWKLKAFCDKVGIPWQQLNPMR